MSDKTVFTIGHSTHDVEYFLTLLHKYSITSLIDIRSTPFSRMAPQFNKDQLKITLKNNKILYGHFEKEFGARHSKPSLLDEHGKVDFDKVKETETFRQGIQRVKNGLELGYKIVLMCSEANPFDCHRFSLIACQLVQESLSVQHILPDGEAVDNSFLEAQLLEKYHKKLPQSTLFETVTQEMQLEAAYRLRGKDVAFNTLKAINEEDKTYD